MDVCMACLDEVGVLLESFEEVSMYQEIFETGDPEIMQKEKNNQQIGDKSVSLLQKANGIIRSIFDKVRAILNNIKVWTSASKEERDEFKQFAEECKKNPEFAKKKVTLVDYREIVARYDARVNEAAKAYEKVKDKEAAEEPSVIKTLGQDMAKLKDQMTECAKRGGAAVTIETAMTWAKADRKNAAALQMLIDHDMGLLDALEKELGKKEIRKNKRKLKMLQSKLGLLRKIAGARQQHALCLQEAFHKTVGNVRGMFKIGVKAVGGKRAAAKLGVKGGRAAVSAVKMYKDAKNMGHAMYKQDKESYREMMKRQLQHEQNVYDRRMKKEG